jgi:aryl-alcohol dehydrogenase-like predicted oxidoreductase
MRIPLGSTGLHVFPLCLGGNVFGWTADEEASRDVLDAYVAGGGNFIDTADSYSAWAPGNRGGESESIIGRWLAGRRDRDELVIATKVGMLDGADNLSPANIRRSLEGSLARLGCGHVDLYWAHQDDPATPLVDTLAAFDGLVRDGLVRHIGASNHGAPRLAEALATSDREGLARYTALQPHYNLIERAGYEADLAPLAVAEGLAVMPYYALAEGFLTGKYRPGVAVASARADDGAAHLDERGLAVLDALDEIASTHDTTVAAVALAWLRDRPGVVAPIASARTVEQLTALLPMATLQLSPGEAASLTAASS